MAATEVRKAAEPSRPSQPSPAEPAPPATPARGDAPAPLRARKERDPFFDNAKFLAILLVVAGHAIGGLRDVPVARAAYVFIYMFHMPLFILITGYLSRNFTLSAGKARKLITHLAVPYVIFEVLYSVYFSVMDDKPLEISLQQPTYVLWFLMATFIWRLSTPVWQQIRWPMGVALTVCLLSYMTDLPSALSLHRAMGLVPFYVLGLMLRPQHVEMLKTRVAGLVGALVLAGGFAFSWFYAKDRKRHWWYWDTGHDGMGVDNLTGTLVRVAMLICAVALVVAFLAVVPTRRTWFTALGEATLYAYLLHDFVVRTVLIYLGVYKVDALHTVPGVVAVALAGCVLATVLCSKPVIALTRGLIQPRMTWAFTALRRPAR
ncbi:acyltransferase family protein [Thermomonospora umbrina]|uniref:Fucose 4-O-acetylase-like acetyltransferase n=1 Tax=Thermomonospora umbrina TaxID=111806 RepID=A0A3D9SRF2_9ACTN|nr:acyltransferase family protein [Thermomonospora umbrina]REE98388.1 fucose 4-O-acetylase-like acetyltransferase [Thermomonospora umbrina]